MTQFAEYYNQNVSDPFGDYASYAFPAEQDAAKMVELRRILDANGIAYGRAQTAATVPAYDYASGRTSKRTVRQGDLIIDAHQPQGGILQVLMDPDPELADSMTYDITAWALPHAMGLEALALTSRMQGAGPWTDAPAASRANALTNPYGWVLPGHGADAIRGLASLLADGVTVRRADTGFSMDGQVFAAGDFVVTRRNNETVADLAGAVRRAGEAAGVATAAVSSGRVTTGYDFGSSHYDAIQAPRIATVAGEGVSSLSAGEIWHHFEQNLAISGQPGGGDRLTWTWTTSMWWSCPAAGTAWMTRPQAPASMGARRWTARRRGRRLQRFFRQEGWGLKRYAEGERADIQSRRGPHSRGTDERNAHDNAAQGLGSAAICRPRP